MRAIADSRAPDAKQLAGRTDLARSMDTKSCRALSNISTSRIASLGATERSGFHANRMPDTCKNEATLVPRAAMLRSAATRVMPLTSNVDIMSLNFKTLATSAAVMAVESCMQSEM